MIIRLSSQFARFSPENPNYPIPTISLRNYELKPHKGLETYRGWFPNPISPDFPRKSANQNLGFFARENKDYAKEMQWIEEKEREIYLCFGGISL